MKRDGIFHIPKPLLAPKIRLICFPYAGGSSSSFFEWSKYFSDSIELVLVQPRGRGVRINESSNIDMLEWMNELLEYGSFFAEHPFVLFGHSLGCWVAYELAKKLSELGLSEPKHIIVSGGRAPHMPFKSRCWYKLSDSDLTEKIKLLNGTPADVLSNSELMELFLPILRADFQVFETYKTKPHQIGCPITVFHGTQDTDITLAQLEGWGELTKHKTQLLGFEGGHFFIHEQRQQVIDKIKVVMFDLLRESQKDSIDL